MLNVLVVFGTRPEAIKMAPVVKQLRCHPDKMRVSLCVTGQHRDMLDQVLSVFGIEPDYDLDLMQANQTPSQVAARILFAMDPLLAELQPDWVLVQGDTTTVMATTIAAHHRRARVGHVEAGLRTYDRNNPFPEEMNRVVVDHVSDVHFAPTVEARQNLLKEGIAASQIHVTGNTVIDALLWAAHKPLPAASEALLCAHGIENGNPLLLVTAHRRENHGEPIRNICRALQNLAQALPQYQIVYPVHRNPNIWQPVHDALAETPGVVLLPPVDYCTLVHLMQRSTAILTDSGGIQEEAPSLGVPVLVLRETTERPEAVTAGMARMVGTEPQRIVDEVVGLVEHKERNGTTARAINPYGDGHAAERIASVLMTGRCTPFAAGNGKNGTV